MALGIAKEEGRSISASYSATIYGSSGLSSTVLSSTSTCIIVVRTRAAFGVVTVMGDVAVSATCRSAEDADAAGARAHADADADAETDVGGRAGDDGTANMHMHTPNT